MNKQRANANKRRPSRRRRENISNDPNIYYVAKVSSVAFITASDTGWRNWTKKDFIDVVELEWPSTVGGDFRLDRMEFSLLTDQSTGTEFGVQFMKRELSGEDSVFKASQLYPRNKISYANTFANWVGKNIDPWSRKSESSNIIVASTFAEKGAYVRVRFNFSVKFLVSSLVGNITLSNHSQSMLSGNAARLSFESHPRLVGNTSSTSPQGVVSPEMVSHGLA